MTGYALGACTGVFATSLFFANEFRKLRNSFKRLDKEAQALAAERRGGAE